MVLPTPTPPWLGGFSNLRREHGFEPLRVEGTLPAALAGTLYRNGAGLFDRFGERCRHWFDADGALTAVRLEGGRAQGAVRLNRTAAFHREEAAGRRLFGGWDTPFARPLAELLLRDAKSPASTSVMPWQGELLALCEGGKPVRVNRESLEPIGETDLGMIRGAFGAHPHAVGSTTWNIGAQVGLHTALTLYSMGGAGMRPRAVTELVVRRPTFIHDFMATERYVVVPAAPWRLRPLRMLTSGLGAMSAAEWLDQPAEYFVIDVREPAAVRRVEAEPHLVEHVLAARDDGAGRIRAWVTRYRDLESREGFLRGLVHGAPERPLGSQVSSVVLDVATGRVELEDLGIAGAELGTAAGRGAYLLGHRSQGTLAPWDSILEVDLDRGVVTGSWEADGYPSEPVIAGEHLLTLVYMPARDASCLAVLRRERLEDGPVARAFFSHPIPFGFHGCWVPS